MRARIPPQRAPTGGSGPARARPRPAKPPRPWAPLVVVGVVAMLALALVGYGSSPGDPGTGAGSGDVFGEADGPIIDASGAVAHARSLPPGVLVLTFDDGPDPTWTPLVLDVLRAEHVPATFFVIGAHVFEHPEVVARARAEGHEIGVHTFSHQRMAALPFWQQDLQLDLTEEAVAAATGAGTHLYRSPYSSTAAGMSRPDLAVARNAAERGYLTVAADRDSRDWARPGVDAIADAALPAGAGGGIVLFHDGGGERAQTVAALRRVIAGARAAGLRFDTVSGALGAAGQPVGAPAPGSQRVQGASLLVAYRVGRVLLLLGTWLLPLIGLLVLGRALVLVHASRRHARLMRSLPTRPFAPAVTVVVPAYNEAVGIERCVRSLVTTDHRGPVEVVVVDDGSTDATADLVAALDLPGVVLVRQANGGKPLALNKGVAHASHDVLVCVDGDTIFQPDTIGFLVQRLADPAVGAVSGNTKVANRSGMLGRWQHVEYVMGFNLERRAYELWDCMPTVPGAIGAFRREAWETVGGASSDTLAEDTDLTMAVNRAGWRVVYEDRAIAWTEAPATLSALWKQRYRWCYGTMQAMWKHRSVLTAKPRNPLGRRALPNLVVFGVVFPMLAPLVDLFALYGLAFLDRRPVMLAWAAFAGMGLAVGAYAFRLDGESPKALWVLPLQQFVYRQLMYLVVFQSVLTALAGSRLGWHKLERSGDFGAADAHGPFVSSRR